MIILKNIPALSDRLLYVRQALNLTQADLARMAGTTQQAIQQAEAGKARAPRYLYKLAAELQIPFEWLSLNRRSPENSTGKTVTSGFSDTADDVINSFYAMPKKDQALILELMKSRTTRKKS